MSSRSRSSRSASGTGRIARLRMARGHRAGLRPASGSRNDGQPRHRVERPASEARRARSRSDRRARGKRGGVPCGGWPLPATRHLGGMVIVRRQGFSNDQWTIEGANLLTLKYREAGIFAADPSQIVRPVGCHDRASGRSTTRCARVPRDRFRLRLGDRPAAVRHPAAAGMQPVWRGPGSSSIGCNHDCAVDRRPLLR